MSNNLEKEFLLELNKRKRKPKIKLIKRIFNIPAFIKRLNVPPEKRS
jgi:hypothetical protein